MKKADNILWSIIKRVLGTVYIPLAVYLVIWMVAKNNGIFYFGDANTWRNIILDTGATATIAYALAVQIKNGRFDFSGGAIMTLGSLVSIYIATKYCHNGIAFVCISVAVCMGLSVAVSFLYVFARVPIIICTVGAAILFESFTLIFNNGQGATISNDAVLNYTGKKVVPLIVLTLLCTLLYLLYSKYSVSGRQAELLSNNQISAVNIGIDERRNVIVSYLISGALYGVAAVIFASQSFQIDVVSSVLGTVSTAFSAMMPVFMGFYIGSFSTDAVGILFSSLALGILQYGINVIAPTGYAGAFKNVIMAFFMIVFFLASRKGPKIIRWFLEKQRDKTEKKAAV